MRVQRVDGAALEAVLDWTYPVWNEGLTRKAYGQWNRGQMETAWGRRHLQRLVLFQDGQPVAAAKRYDFQTAAGAGEPDVVGIGAVFTAPEQRGRGHAAALIEAMVDDAARRGCRFALLFSEIGASYYQRLGFHVVPQALVTVEISAPRRGAPAVLLRTGEVHDLPQIAEIAARATAPAAFALQRSAELITFGITRKRLLAGLGPAGLRQVEFFVTEEGSRAVAYVIVTHGPQGVTLLDCGDRDPSGARVGAMLQVLAARTPAAYPWRIAGWFPRGLVPPQLAVTAVAPAAEIMMIRPIAADAAIPSGPETIFPLLDYF